MLFDFLQGDTPVLVNVPHAGTQLLPGIAERFLPASRKLPDTDWHVDRLTASAPALGATFMRALCSRYVVDLNRPSDDRPLYTGATTGLVPTVHFDGSPVYAERAPDSAGIGRRIEQCWRPYHQRLEQALADLQAAHGFAVLLDVHSIRSRVPRLFDGRLPDLNLGTYDGRSCAADLQDRVARILADARGFSHVVNGRFKGGFITRHYGRPAEGVHALQLEIAQACYMDEARPEHWDPERARPLVAVLESIVAELIRWRPA